MALWLQRESRLWSCQETCPRWALVETATQVRDTLGAPQPAAHPRALLQTALDLTWCTHSRAIWGADPSSTRLQHAAPHWAGRESATGLP